MAANKFLQSYGTHLAVYTIGGFILGNIAMKVTRKIGCAAGLGIIGYEVAHHNGFVNTGLDSYFGKFQSKMGESCSKYCSKTSGQMKSMAGKNRVMAVGLISGSLLGISCT